MNWPLLWKLFFVFTKVALFSWGGGPASLALMQRETTTATWLPPNATSLQPWVTPDEFADAVALGNSLPGPIAPQVSAYVGYKLAGAAGAIAAAAGTVLPTTLIMLIVIIFFFNVKDNPSLRAMITAVRPLVIGLLLWTAYDMAISVFKIKQSGWTAGLSGNLDKVAIALASFVLLATTEINPVILVIACAAIGFFVYR